MFIVGILFAVNAVAIPGIDTAQALKQYYVLLKQLKTLKEQVKQADGMLSQGKQVIKDAEGHYGFGRMFDSDAEYQSRQWGADRWEDTLKDLSGGNSARYRELLKEYKKNILLCQKISFPVVPVSQRPKVILIL